MSTLLRQIFRIPLRWYERAVDRPYTAEASSRIDAALVRLEGEQ
jgi:hypothetical protein